MIWALMVLLTWRHEPTVTWHASYEACQSALERELRQHPDAVHAMCRSYPRPRLRPMTGEVLR